MSWEKKVSAMLAISLLFVTLVSLSPCAYMKPLEVKTSRFMDANRNKIFDSLESIMAGRGDDALIDVILLFKKEPTEDLLEHLHAEVGMFKVKSKWTVVPGIAASLTSSQIRALTLLDDVIQVEYDAPVYACLNTATYWYGVQKARTDFGLDGDRDGSPTTYSKDDIVIAIIDTGIDPNHVDLDGGKIIGWKDFVNGKTTPYDDNGHGTHCASIAAGTGEGNSAYKGVAPGAALVGVKVLDASGSGTLSRVADGINWAVANKDIYGIEILSLSLGTSTSSDGTDTVSMACNNAVDQGLVVVVAAGNNGPKTYTVGSPGAAEKVITVGSIADVGHKGFFLNSWSSRGPTADGRIKPDVCAPGYLIMAAKAGTTSSYVEYSGTSMATPFVAGTVALMLDANPSLTPTQIKSIIATTSIDFGPSGKDIDYGWGRLDAYEAIKTAGGYSGTGIAVPSHFAFTEDLSRTGAYDLWKITVTTTSYPIAVTLIMPTWSSATRPNFNIYLYNPSGSLIASSTGTTRQEIIAVTISVSGTYTLRVYSSSGSGTYYLDISAGASSVYLSYDG
ncbi:S8 family serine peptidase [Candidatus Bathyarchaeota archaeon]|nr:S8 family serine peptidase [Candidatus Bathyarchaeota archaeon]